MPAASNKRVTFTLSDGHSDNVSDGGQDNPFQAPDLAEDAEMILTLWRSGSLHTSPAASLSPPVSIRNVSVWPLTSIEFLTRVTHFFSEWVKQKFRIIDRHYYSDRKDQTNEDVKSLVNHGAIGNQNTSAVNDLKTEERKNVLFSKKIFQTYHKIKEKIMILKCFVIKKNK